MENDMLNDYVAQQPILKDTYPIDIKSENVALYVKPLNKNGEILCVLYLLTYASNEWRLETNIIIPRLEAKNMSWNADKLMEYSRVYTDTISAVKHGLCEYVIDLEIRGRDIASIVPFDTAVTEICTYIKENRDRLDIFTHTARGVTYYCVQQAGDALQGICNELDLGWTGKDIIEQYNLHYGFDLASEGRKTYRPTGGKRVYAFRSPAERRR